VGFCLGLDVISTVMANSCSTTTGLLVVGMAWQWRAGRHCSKVMCCFSCWACSSV
jgi:hypothetical protein